MLTNPAMPGLVKIGCTSQADIAARLNQLYSTGVPFPFEVDFAARVENPEEVEQALHQAFSPYRVNPRREFFEIESSQAIAILKLLHVQDATQEVERVATAVEPVESAAGQNFRSRRPALNYLEMGIPIGSSLTFNRGNAIAVVTSPKKVTLDGIEMSLTAATRQLLNLDYDVAPGRYWTYNGQTIDELYERTYRRES